MNQQPMNRRRALVLLGVGTTTVTVAGMGAGRLVRSPQQVRADAAPPPRTVLTATVESRVLRDTVVLRGLVGAQYRVDAAPAPAEAGRPVVTGIRVHSGQRVGSGTVLVEVSGRPLIALPGHIPAYRDLRPGMQGSDIRQLQAGLRSLGLNPHESSGTFGAGTKAAVGALYQRLGYQPASTGPDSLRQVADATEQVRQRQRVLDQAEQAVVLLGHSPERDQAVTFAQQDLAAAKAALAALEQTTGNILPMSEVVFLPAFPARVEKVDAAIGGPVKTPMITLSSGPLVIVGRLNPADRPLVKPGMPVEVDAELLGATGHGVVSSVGELSSGEDGSRYHPLLVVPARGAFAEALNDADVRLSVIAASTPGPVLVVPVSAVFADAAGHTSVLRVRPDGHQDRIAVSAGPTGDGYVAVAGDLHAGDSVVIGATGR